MVKLRSRKLAKSVLFIFVLFIFGICLKNRYINANWLFYTSPKNLELSLGLLKNDQLIFELTQLFLDLNILYLKVNPLSPVFLNWKRKQEFKIVFKVAQLKTWLRVPPKARAITKSLLRQSTAQKLIDNKEADTEVFVSLVGSEKVQKDLGR